MPDWAVQQMRVSLFSNAPIALTEASWKTVTGQDEAENRISIPGGKQFSGKDFGAAFTLAYTGPRCDLIVTGEDGNLEFGKEARLPVAGAWDELSKTFEERVSPFVENLEFPVIRIAFGAILLAPVENKEGAYRTLAELLQSLDVDPVRMRELNFRVNWPRQSEVMESLELNRITSWSAILLSQSMVQLSGTDMTFAPAGPELHAVRLELDHNTSAAHKEPFEKTLRIPIFRELVGLARENASKGEHP